MNPNPVRAPRVIPGCFTFHAILPTDGNHILSPAAAPEDALGAALDHIRRGWEEELASGSGEADPDRPWDTLPEEREALASGALVSVTAPSVRAAFLSYVDIARRDASAALVDWRAGGLPDPGELPELPELRIGPPSTSAPPPPRPTLDPERLDVLARILAAVGRAVLDPEALDALAVRVLG